MKHLCILLFFLCTSLGAQEYRIVNIAPGPIITVEKIDSSDGDMSNMFGDKKGKGSIDSKIGGSKTRSLLKVDMCRLVKGCDPKAAAEYVKNALAGKKIEVSSEQDAENRDINITSTNESLSAIVAKWAEERKKESDAMVVKLVDASTDQTKDNPDKLAVDFAGVYMGDYKKNVVAMFKSKNIKLKDERLENGIVTMTFLGHPQLKEVRETELRFWNSKLVGTTIIFSDKTKYGDAKLSLENKFGKFRETTRQTNYKDTIPAGNGEFMTITRTNVSIEAETKSSGMEMSLFGGGGVFITVKHITLEKQKAASEAAKLGKF